MSAAPAFEITVRRRTPEYVVRVEFSDEITLSRQRALYDAIYDVLSELTGVEQVVMHRYSAHVHFAQHITTHADLIAVIVDALKNDAWVVDELDAVYPDRGITSY